MNWVDFFKFALTIVGPVIGAIWYLHKDHKEEIKALKEDLKAHALRTDRLYEMFIDLLKQRKE